MELTLYKTARSPPARAVVMIAKALGIQLQEKYVDFAARENYSPEYLKKNPQHTVPVLEDDGFVVWDSHAISVYLVTVYGKDDSLYPKDPKQRAIIDQRLHFDTGILFKSLRELVVPVIYKGATTLNAKTIDSIKEGYDFVEAFLENKPWFAGDQVTIADIHALTTISNAIDLVPIDENTHPRTMKWLKKCEELPFVKGINQPGVRVLTEFILSKVGKI